MKKPASIDVTLELRRLADLYTAPDYDPLHGHAEELSGLDRLMNELRSQPRVPVRARLVLPASERTPDLDVRCRSALRAVLQRRLERNRNDALSLRQEGYATLWRGLLFLAVCLLGSRIMAEVTLLPGFMERFLDEGLVIAGWVALWYPLDVLLYQWWPLARERNLYERLRDLQLDFAYQD